MHHNWPLGADSGGVKVKGLLFFFFFYASAKHFTMFTVNWNTNNVSIHDGLELIHHPQ